MLRVGSLIVGVEWAAAPEPVESVPAGRWGFEVGMLAAVVEVERLERDTRRVVAAVVVVAAATA